MLHQPPGLLKEFRMSSCPDKNYSIGAESINQQEIAADVAFTMTGPVADKFNDRATPAAAAQCWRSTAA